MARPFIMDGVAYITGRGQGHLYALAIQSGEVLLDLACPETFRDSRVAFAMPVIGQNRKIYLDSHASTYAYQATKKSP